MRLKIFILFSLLLLSFPFVTRADFSTDYQAFLRFYDEYRTTHGKYVETRNQYLTFGTLTSKNDALVALKNFLIARDEVLRSYMGLIQQKNIELAFSPQIADESQFLTTHLQTIPGLTTVEDAVSSSKEVESRHVQLQTLTKKVTGMLFVSRIENLRTQFNGLKTDVEGFISDLKSQNKDTVTLEKWLEEAKRKDEIVAEKLDQARQEIHKFSASDVTRISQEFSKIQFIIFEAHQNEKEALSFIHELSESIKYGKY